MLFLISQHLCVLCQFYRFCLFSLIPSLRQRGPTIKGGDVLHLPGNTDPAPANHSTHTNMGNLFLFPGLIILVYIYQVYILNKWI